MRRTIFFATVAMCASVLLAVPRPEAASATTSEWSSYSIDVTPVGSRAFLGQFGSETVSLSLADLPAHEETTITFDLFVIQSWDGNYRGYGPDVFDLSVAEGPTLLHTTFASPDTGWRQAYPDAFPGGRNPGGTGATEVNTLGYPFFGDSVYHLTFSLPHSDATIRFDFSAALSEGIPDESWGLDNVHVAADGEVVYSFSGSKPRIRHYEGSTSEGGRIAVTVAVADGAVRLQELGLGDVTWGCEDGTEGAFYWWGFGWGAGGPALPDERLDLTQADRFMALTVTGRLGTHRGSGTLTLLLPGLTEEEQAQVCTIGELAWTLERSAGDVGSPSGRTALVRSVGGQRITVVPAGASERTTAAARPESRPTRHYRGRTSQGATMGAKTRRTDEGVVLLGFSWGWTLGCEDGTEVVGGSGYGFPEGWLLPPGRLDLDFAVVGPGDALHLHGDLDPHLGGGTIAFTWPALTEDLQAQLCTTGELTWNLWRTDAGY